MQLDSIVIVLLALGGISRHDSDHQSCFLPAFADRRFFGCLARIDLAAGELPQTRQGDAVRPLTDQETTITLDNSDCNPSGSVIHRFRF
jgi:hypothetical protein